MNRFVAPLASSLFAFAIASPSLAKPYKGAELYSQQDYQYGKIEMRMRMARGSGLLSTFFLYKDGSEQPGTFWEEVDIEVFGKDNATTWQSNIIVGDPRRLDEGVHEHEFSFADDYHTFTVEWSPDSVRWLVDGEEVRLVEGGHASELTNPQSVRFNIWAAFDENWVGPFDDSVLPQYQFVNWVKFYRYEDGAFLLDWEDDFDTFDNSRWGKATWTFAENRVDFSPENLLVQDGTLVMALTKEGEEGFFGEVPIDNGESAGGTDSGTGGASQPVDGGNAGASLGGEGGGTTGDAGTGAVPDAPGDESGCGCHTVGSAPRFPLAAWALIALGALPLVRRRLRRQA